MRSSLRFSRLSLAALLLCCAWIGPVCAAEKNSSYQAALASIKAEELAGHVGQLADPAMEGREAGSRGGHAAGDYLAEQYARLHLHGAGTDGGSFQPFPPNFRNILVDPAGQRSEVARPGDRRRSALRPHRLRRAV